MNHLKVSKFKRLIVTCSQSGFWEDLHILKYYYYIHDVHRVIDSYIVPASLSHLHLSRVINYSMGRKIILRTGLIVFFF